MESDSVVVDTGLLSAGLDSDVVLLGVVVVDGVGAGVSTAPFTCSESDVLVMAARSSENEDLFTAQLG